MNWGLHKMAWRTRSIFHGALKLKVRNASGEELRCVQTALKPCCAMRGHFFWETETDNFICNNVRGERHSSVRAHLLLSSHSMRYSPPPPAPPPPRSTWPRVFSHVRAASLTMRSRDRPSSATHSHAPVQTSSSNTRLTREPKKRKTLLFSAFHLDRNMTQLALPYRHRGPKKFLSLSA